MPSRNVMIGAYVGVMVVLLIIVLYASSGTTSTPTTPTTPTTPPVTTPVKPPVTTPVKPPVTTPVKPPVITPQVPPVQNWCDGGLYCNGVPVMEANASIGSVVCGANNRAMTCTKQASGAPKWVTGSAECSATGANRCPPPTQVVVGNDGTVSGQTYCAGLAGAPWWSELPVSWGGAKCVSAGFNAGGTPTGVDCNTIPGRKTGFRVQCQQNPVGWQGAPIVVKRNDGTVSGQRYCAGVNGASWNNELPMVWQGAKCVSAGYQTTGMPSGVDCATVPGNTKPDFRVQCIMTNGGWAK